MKPPAGSSIHPRNDHTQIVVDIITQSHTTRGRLIQEVDAVGCFAAKPPPGVEKLELLFRTRRNHRLG